ncbi:type II toxin-antitoxin system RelE/ParE family toxin [Parapedobacter tibetensis]|uniref:type II toxin-antitoxin system RelE/ParE family toxin n=1 Tax=Parapedobacter tibetensis TaxID=2972951 RepID=UPI00214D8F8F|nr:type II toxin-antitoxin system RelE/ParE family toxin [Parapedobacter tibetensis]
MKFNIHTIAYFDKQFKRLTKKYPSLKVEFLSLVDTLKNNPTTGTPIGNDCYKIRIAIASKGKGKSGGARAITYVTIKDSTVFLLSIYDKSNQSSISDKELLKLLEHVK